MNGDKIQSFFNEPLNSDVSLLIICIESKRAVLILVRSALRIPLI